MLAARHRSRLPVIAFALALAGALACSPSEEGGSRLDAAKSSMRGAAAASPDLKDPFARGGAQPAPGVARERGVAAELKNPFSEGEVPPAQPVAPPPASLKDPFAGAGDRPPPSRDLQDPFAAAKPPSAPASAPTLKDPFGAPAPASKSAPASPPAPAPAPAPAQRPATLKDPFAKG